MLELMIFWEAECSQMDFRRGLQLRVGKEFVRKCLATLNECVPSGMREMFKRSIPKRPEAFLIAIIGTEAPKKMTKLFTYVITAARILYSQKWKEEKVATKEEWLLRVNGPCRNGKADRKIKRSKDKLFIEDWRPFVDYQYYSQMKLQAGYEIKAVEEK